MRIWKYRARSHTERLAHRLKKYDGGQLLLETTGETYRGQISSFRLDGTKIDFQLLWLARRFEIRRLLLANKWRWEIQELRTHANDSTSVLFRCKTINLELVDSGHLGDERPAVRGAKAGIDIDRFHQNKAHLGRIAKIKVLYPKCLFFDTTFGEHGVLFQPSDPRNLKLEKDGTITDPLCPK